MSDFPDKAWRLPWSGADVPHALLDIIRGCNIHCRICYNQIEPRVKPLDEIEAELTELMRHRKLQSISVVGGEPLLHPDMYDIIRLLKRNGLHIELFTNGLMLDTAACARLKEAGASVVFIHIDSGQRRPDLPASEDANSRQRLIQEKAALLAEAGLESGLAITAYPGQTQEVEESVRLTLASPHLGYLLVTRFREHSGIRVIHGCLDTGMTAEIDTSAPPQPPPLRAHQDMRRLLQHRFGLRPFAFFGSNRDPDDTRWLSFQAGTLQHPNGKLLVRNIRISAFERLFVALHRHRTGSYPCFYPWNAVKFRFQLLLNAISGGHLIGNLRLLASSLLPGRKLHSKHLLFQNPAEVDAYGNVTHCLNCPDAVLHNGRLVPVCLADLCE